MKNITAITLVVLSLLTAPAYALASSWTIDPAHTSVGFKIRHMMITNVRGEFSDVKGTAEFNAADITKSSIEITIQAASIDTGVARRDAHLRSADFFDVEKFPTLTFRSTKVTQISKGRVQIQGDLTIHGVTREVLLEAEGPTQEIKGPGGKIRIGASATTKINRKNFGLNWNVVLEAGGVLVGEEVTITLDIELVKQGD